MALSLVPTGSVPSVGPLFTAFRLNGRAGTRIVGPRPALLGSLLAVTRRDMRSIEPRSSSPRICCPVPSQRLAKPPSGREWVHEIKHEATGSLLAGTAAGSAYSLDEVSTGPASILGLSKACGHCLCGQSSSMARQFGRDPMARQISIGSNLMRMTAKCSCSHSTYSNRMVRITKIIPLKSGRQN